jgi:hypothetical protein
VDEAGDVFAFLDGADEEDQIFTRRGGFFGQVDAVGDDADARGGNAEQRFDLIGSETRHGNDGVAEGGGAASLIGETGAKFGRGIISGHHEEIVKSADGFSRTMVDTLVQCVKEIAGGFTDQQTADGVRGERVAVGAQESMGAVAELKVPIGVRGGEAVHDFA